MKDKHQKHPPIKRPEIGNYHRLEWAIYGTTCGEIEAFYNQISKAFSSKYRLSYIDADHSDEKKDVSLQVGKKQYKQDYVFEANPFDDKLNVELSQAVFVNGNHYPAKRQIIIINDKKRDSLKRRVDHLDQIDAVIVPEDETLFDFVKEKMTAQTKVYSSTEMDMVLAFIEEEIKIHVPKLKAIILAGGKSTRMNEDKSQLKYHGDLSQEVYLANICQNLGIETYISKSSQEDQSSIDGFQVLKDRYVDMGPFGAILSAFMHDPETAWLVLACDLPYVSERSVKHLVENRSMTHYATAYKVEDQPFPQPLIAIYEPAIYRRMLNFLTLGYACPRKVLINSDVHHVLLEDKKVALNVNTQEERENVMNQLNSNT